MTVNYTEYRKTTTTKTNVCLQSIFFLPLGRYFCNVFVLLACLSDLVHQVESDNLAARLSATRVLCAMAAANAEVCYAVASRIVPAVCTACQKLSQVRNSHR